MDFSEDVECPIRCLGSSPDYNNLSIKLTDGCRGCGGGQPKSWLKCDCWNGGLSKYFGTSGIGFLCWSLNAERRGR